MSYCHECKYFGHRRFTGEFICNLTGRPCGWLESKECFTPREKEMENKGDNQGQAQTKVCKKCGRELPVTDFSKHPHTPDGLQMWCKECMKESARESRKRKRRADPETEEGKAVKDKWERKADAVAVLANATDYIIFEELKRRGYSGTLVKKTEVTI